MEKDADALLRRVLIGEENESVIVVCVSSLTDAAQLLRSNERLFTEKAKLRSPPPILRLSPHLLLLSLPSSHSPSPPSAPLPSLPPPSAPLPSPPLLNPPLLSLPSSSSSPLPFPPLPLLLSLSS